MITYNNNIKANINKYTLQFQIIEEEERRRVPNKPNKRGGLKIALGQKWQPVMGIMGIVESSTISRTSLPSRMFSSFSFLMFGVFSFQEKSESLHSRLRRD